LKLVLACLMSLGSLASLAGSSVALANTSPAAVPLVPDQGGGAADGRIDTNTAGSTGLEGRVGTFQLMLMAPPIGVDASQAQALELPGASQLARGFGITHSFGGSNAGYIGLGAGLGYTLTSLVELGGALSFSYLGGDVNTFDLNLEPFIKLNLGPTWHLGAINPFVLAGIDIGVVAPGEGPSAAIFGIDIDPGVEWLFGGRWGVDVYVPIQILVPSESGADVGFNLGVGYGLVGYL
jgi:hypothetical protein